MFKDPPDDHVVEGTPIAFPKPFNDLPPDKNIEPSVKIAAVGGGKSHCSLLVVSDPVYCAAIIADVDVPLPEPALASDAFAKSFTSVHEVQSQDSVFVVLGGVEPPQINAAVVVPIPH